MQVLGMERWKGLTGEQRMLWWLAAGAIGALGALVLGVPKLLVVEAIGFVVAIGVIGFVFASTLYGRVEFVVLSWVLFFPLGYYFLSFPRERSVFTLDRAVMVICLIAIAFSSRSQQNLPESMRKAGWWWAVFLVAAFSSLRNMENALGASKEVLDAFVFPATLALFVWIWFPVRKYLPELHLLSSLMCMYAAAISVMELFTGEDLLPLPEAIFFSDDTGIVQRVNGPFATNNSLGLIGLISFFLLLFLGRAIGRRMPVWQRGIHMAGLTSALIMALSPMFRSIAMTLVLVWAIEVYTNRDLAVRLKLVGAALVGVFGLLFLRQTAPGFFESRVSDMSDLYARIAQYEQTWALFKSHPINGVGLANYATVAESVPAAYFRGVESVGSAHNTLASILADTGITGFVGYFLAQVFFCVRSGGCSSLAPRKRVWRAAMAFTFSCPIGLRA